MKYNQRDGLFRHLYNYLPLLQIYKSFAWSHLDYCDIYHRPIFHGFRSEYFLDRTSYDPKNIDQQVTNIIKAVEYNIRGICKEKLYSDLPLSSLSSCHSYHCLLLFYKVSNDFTPNYLKKFIPIYF